MSTDNQNSLRDALRTATVGSSPTFRSEIVEYGGHEFEVRELSPKRRERSRVRSLKKGSDDEVDQDVFSARLIIASVFEPGTDTQVFEDGDVQSIVNSPASGYFKVFAEAVVRLAGESDKAGNE